MDRNTTIGMVLMGAILVAFMFSNQRDAAEQQRLAAIEKARQDSIAALVDTTKSEQQINLEATSSDQASISAGGDSAKTAYLQKEFGIFYPSVDQEAKEVKIENEKWIAWINTKGATISRVYLKEFKSYLDYSEGNEIAQLDMFFSEKSKQRFLFRHKGKKYQSDEFVFEADKTDMTITGEQSESVKFRLKTDDPGKYVEMIYSIKGNDYLLDWDVHFVGLDREVEGLEGQNIVLDWKQATPRQEKGLDNERNNSTIYYQDSEDVDDVGMGANAEEVMENNVDWISFKQQYFSTILVDKNNCIKTGAKLNLVSPEDEKINREFSAYIPLEFANSHQTYSFSMYIGPNDYTVLKEYDLGLEDNIYFGWPIISWAGKYILTPFFKFLEGFNLGYGLIILLLTLTIKLVLFPITYKTYLSSAKMRVLKPFMDKINEENKDADPMKKQQAVMNLYKETGVNPMAGCIPQLLQIPILWAMFRFFPASIDLRQEGFLWADDLSGYDSVLDLGFNIWVYGDHISLFTLLMAISMFFYTRMNASMTPTAPTGGDDTQKMMATQMKFMMNFMPVMMLFFFNNYAAGLSYYYLVANLVTMGQTFAIKKFFIDEKAILAKIEEHRKKPIKKSKWQKKMEEIAEKQQNMNKKR